MGVRLVTVLSALALLLAALVPTAFAQDAAEEGDGARGNTTIVICSQVQNAFANQGQYANGGANAVATDGSVAVAEIAQELNISQNQVLNCLGGGGGETTEEETTAEETTAGETTAEETSVMTEGEDAVDDDTVLDADELPETGGSSGVLLASGCALLGVGLILNRILR
jgi:hypothetical protein